MDLGPGDHFAGLRIEGVAGRGGMGVVYRAVQPSLDRVVALKTIAPALAADPAFSARFVRESKAAAAVEHPNVLPIFSAGAEQDVLYIVMRYVDGPDLRSLIREEGRIAPDRAATIVAQVAAALEAAHARGLVHRDVKPANVLLAHRDHAYLTDFGLTKRLHSEASAVTRAGGWVGTLGYVAPEQIRDEHVDGRTDVYALGCVLFHALTGAPPYDRTSDEATLWAHLNDPPPRLPADLPAGLGDAIACATAKDPDDRYASARDFGRAVLAAVGRPPASVAGLHTQASPSAGAETRVTPPDARPDAGTAVTTPAERATPTAPSTPAAPAVPAARRGPPTLLPAVAAVAVAAIVVAIVALSGGVGGPDGRGGADQSPKAHAPAPLRLEGVDVGSRPNGVAVAGGAAYVIRPRGERLRKVDAGAFERAVAGPRIGRGALDIDAGYGALWVTSATDRERLIRIDLESGLRTTDPLPDGQPVAVEAGENAVWVGLRGARLRSSPRPAVARIDPRNGEVVRTIEVPRGVQDLAVGGGAVWVTNRSTDTVTRIDVRSGEHRVIPVGRGPAGIALGGGSVWVANSEESTVTRIDRQDPSQRATIGVAGQPRFVAYGGGSLWVSTFASSTLVRVNGKTGRQTGDAVDVALNPTKVTVVGGNVYVVSSAGGRLERIGFGTSSGAG
jgi:hypothetical protein